MKAQVDDAVSSSDEAGAMDGLKMRRRHLLPDHVR